ncbi:MAG: hypothetical protein WCE54_03730 [Ignavibacteriaceae bacterium]
MTILKFSESNEINEHNNSLNYRQPAALKNNLRKSAAKDIFSFASMRNRICKELQQLQNFGFKVFSFNKKDRLSFGLKYFVNHIIVSKKYLIFIEVNPGKEFPSDDKKSCSFFYLI